MVAPSDSKSSAAPKRILLVGNPNVGKSVLFGALTRRYVVVSNYPGTTVEVARGTTEIGGDKRELVDLPGVNDLIPHSEDEQVTRGALLTDDAERVLQVTDAKNLRRGLLLTVGLAEMGLPFVLVLNMMDEALARGVRIDQVELSAALGVPVLFSVATRGKGVAAIRKALAEEPGRSRVHVEYDPAIEEAVAELEPRLPEERVTRRSLALMLLAGDDGIQEWSRERLSAEVDSLVRRERRELRGRLRNTIAYEISRARLRTASVILDFTYEIDPALTGTVEKVARFGETVRGRGVAHVLAFSGIALLLLAMGGFPFSPLAVAICGAVVGAAILLFRSRWSSPLILLATLAGCWLLGMAVRPISEVIPVDSFFRFGVLQGLYAFLLLAGVLLARQTMNLVWGTLSGLAVLYLVYLFVGVFGAGDLVDVLETGLFGKHVGPACISAVDAVLPFPHEHVVDPEVGAIVGEYTIPEGVELTSGQSVARFFHDLLVGPFGALTMALSYAIALILPVVGTFFLVFGILEDSGYLPRLAVMMNRGFRAMGLNGKAVLPMVLGLGCDTMATLTTRVLETKKERVIVTLLLALGIPCSAQLGVILGITSQIGTPAILWWVGTVVFILFTVGWLSSLILPGRRSDFILELPPLRVPRIGNIVLKTVARIEWYLKEAVPLFFLGTLILFLLDKTGALKPLTWASAPIVKGWLGLPEETTPAFLIGFLRRDYGAAGLSAIWRAGLMTPRQAVVALVTITLFVPCVANFFIMIKERGLKTGVGMFVFIFPFAFLVGGLLNLLLTALGALE